ncbi:MAG: TrgA family protein [Paracoccaceae bacterium]|nr:TrgA family protein [Paracoccaceae bacterium]
MARTRTIATPTMARLVSILAFGALGWFLAGQAVTVYVDEAPPAHFMVIAIGIAALSGWLQIGLRAGGGYAPAVAQGVTWVFVFGVCLTTYLGSLAMIEKFLLGIYRDFGSAMIDLFDLIWLELVRFSDVTLLATAVAGGVVAAVMVEFFGQKFG